MALTTASILLDDARGGAGRAMLYEAPRQVIQADEPGEVARALGRMQTALQEGAHLAGFFSYELGYALESRLHHLMPDGRRVPLLWFGVFGQPRILEGEAIKAFLEQEVKDVYRISPPMLTMTREAYGSRFQKVKTYIGAGDIYQINLTLKGRFTFEGDPAALYHDLRRKQAAGHAALVRTGELIVISASPELFLEVDNNRALTRPMKGTARRGPTPEADEEMRRWLASDAKSRAENLMIVDLMRNDLGRVAETGSVRVSDLFTVETYQTLHQMTSGVEARLRPGLELGALLESVFPPGSVTGAPKLRAAEIIRELETEPRGVYTGAVGAIWPQGARFNVAIRTLTLFPSGEGEIGIGSGLVQDSAADNEYDECLLKMRFLTEPVRDFKLIETLRFDPHEGYFVLERHLDRLEASARYFGFAFLREAARRALEEKARDLTSCAHRVRLLLGPDGSLAVSAAPMPDSEAPKLMRYVVSDHHVESSDVFLYHKTTERRLFDSEYTRHAERSGADEVLFLNERGEVTEGSRTNIFARIGGRLLTPALECGLLAGTLRADLLARGEAREAVLTLRDLEKAEAVYLGNSVRGLIPAHSLDSAQATTALS